MKLKDIKIESPFKDLFPVDREIYEAIKKDISEFGYDESQGIIVWDKVVIDGHTRLKAAFELGIEDIPVFEKDFANEEDALEYAIHNQRDRRNMSDADIMRCVEIVDKRMKSGGDHKSESFRNQDIKSNNLISDPSHIQTARMVGVSPSKVQQTRKVIDNATVEEKEQIETGQKTIHSVYKGIKEQEKRAELRKPAEKPIFNRSQKDEKQCSCCGHIEKENISSIEWAYWTWNPVTGCKHGCPYCYARDIANRFYEEKFEPTFHPERLTAPKNTPIPKNDMIGEHNVFVCSMADLFGEWVPDEWIQKVFKAIEQGPKWWNYIFLTKNPKRYLKLDFPERCWIGATGDIQKRVDEAMEVFRELYYQEKQNKRFLSCEPLGELIDLNLEDTDDPDVFHLPIDWLIVGGRSQSSGMPAGQPEWEWVYNLINQMGKAGMADRIYWKPNLMIRPKYYPELGK